MEYTLHKDNFTYAAAAASRSDVYKRKAWELFFSECLANGQAREVFAQEYRDIWHRKLQRTTVFPQKKQRVAAPQYQCQFHGCQAVFKTERDRVFHMTTHVAAQDYDSSETTGGSPHWLDSSTGHSAESIFDSHGSDQSSRPTSPSSSHTRNYEDIQAEVKPRNFSRTINGQHTRSNLRVPTARVQQGSLKIWATPRPLPDQKMILSPTSSTMGETKVRQVTVVDGNRAGIEISEHRGSSSRDGDDDQPPFTGSGMSSGTSQPTAPSVMETDHPSTEGDSSSKSQTSSSISETSTDDKDEDNTQPGNKLEDLVKNHVLRADPEVAQLFLSAVGDQLEYASNEDIEHLEDCTGFSVLHLLGLPRSSDAQDCPGLTTYAPSSSSGSSSSSPGHGVAASSSPNGQIGSSGGGAQARDSSAPGGAPSQMIKGQKTSTKSGASNSTKTQPLRCFHNALISEVFCVNHETQERFRACAGPGWSSIQHLKEHMQSHHTKKVKKPNSLQCSDCQDKFESQEELKSHKEDIDCSIQCRDCPEVFDTKAKRTDHQREMHPEEETELSFLEIDDAMWKKIKENLKAYSESVKKGPKGKGRSDPGLESWVEANTARFMIGRSAKTNPKQELGQWYTIFKTLAPSAEILEHPFYDYGMIGKIPASDFIEEKIIFINDNMIDSRIKAHGPPPSDIQLQRDWYRGVLRESLQVAAQTIFVPRKKTVASSSQVTKVPVAEGGSVVQNTRYDTSIMPASHGSQMDYLPHGSSGMSLQSEAFLTNDQPQTGMIPGLSNGMSGGTPSMAGSMGIDSWIYPQGSMSGGVAQPLDTQYSYGYSPELHLDFQSSDPNLLPDHQFTSDWRGCEGRQGQQRR